MKDRMDMLLAKALHSDENIDPAVNEKLIKIASGEGGKELFMKTSDYRSSRTQKTGRRKWVPVAAAIALCIIPASVYAGSKVAGYVATSSAVSPYQSYGDVAKVSKKAGFSFDSVERFSNGYRFQEMDILDTDKQDEDGHKAGSFKEVDMTYSKKGSSDISLTVHETQPEDAAPADYREVKKCTGADGAEYDLYYSVDHYKFVPEDYELTEEDKANQEKPDYFISVGTDEVEETDVSYLTWSKDGNEYMLMATEEFSGDELFAMAEEILK